jgi:uncharacterized membrane protein YfcA
MLAILGITFFFVSIIFTMFGLGGGTLYVPIMLSFSFSYSVSAGTSLLLIMVGAISAAVIFARSGLIDWKFALAINSISDLAAFFGGYSLFPPSLLLSLFVLVLIASGTFMLKEIEPSFSKRYKGRFFVWNHQFRDNSYSISLPLMLSAFLLVGFWSGALGIGGGVFKIPLMIAACGFPLRIAIATSSLMIATSSFWGVMGHLKAGTINLSLGIPLAAVVFLGGQLGSRISIKTHKDLLRKGFAAILYIVALKMISSVLFPIYK